MTRKMRRRQGETESRGVDEKKDEKQAPPFGLFTLFPAVVLLVTLYPWQSTQRSGWRDFHNGFDRDLQGRADLLDRFQVNIFTKVLPASALKFSKAKKREQYCCSINCTLE